MKASTAFYKKQKNKINNDYIKEIIYLKYRFVKKVITISKLRKYKNIVKIMNLEKTVEIIK